MTVLNLFHPIRIIGRDAVHAQLLQALNIALRIRRPADHLLAMQVQRAHDLGREQSLMDGNGLMSWNLSRFFIR